VTVTALNAVVDILQGVATTRLLIRLRNPSPRPQEASLLLSVPAGATVHAFDFQGSAAEPTAEIVEAGKAKATYNHIVAKLRDPALLEFVGTSLIRTSVFPVPASGEQAVEVTYEHILPSAGGRLEYLLPRTARLVDSNIPFSLTMRIRSVRPLSAVYSPTHPIRATRVRPEEILVELGKHGDRAPGSFLLTLLPESGDLSATLLAYPDPSEGGGTFLLLAGLPAAMKRGTDNALKREVTLVLDRSGSMRGRKIEQAKAALLQVLQSLEMGETFNIITYNSAVNAFAEHPVVKTPETEAQARAYIHSISATGGTNLHDAVLEALKPLPAEGMLPLVLLLSDGLPTVGVTSEVDIRNAVKKGNGHHRRLYTFGVGHDVNVPLLDRLAQGSRGSMTCVLPKENVEEKVSVLFDKLAGPLFTSPVLTAHDDAGNRDTRAIHDCLPREIPDLFRGDRLILLGRYRNPGPLRFRLSGTFLGKPRAFTFRFDLKKASLRNAFVPRLWASRKIAVLIDALRQAGAESAGIAAAANLARATAATRPTEPAVPLDPKTKELVDEIVRLSIKYGILTEYTSFLALEGTNLNDAEVLSKNANGNFQRWAVRKRHGGHAVSQQMNGAWQRGQANLNFRNEYFDRNMNRVQITNVQQMADLSFFRRGGRWVDARIAANRNEIAPDEVVPFGSERFEEVLGKLLSANRQGVLSLGGEVLFELEGKVIRLTFPKGK
jgi:Ca-activated chloride channel family protein